MSTSETQRLQTTLQESQRIVEQWHAATGERPMTERSQKTTALEIYIQALRLDIDRRRDELAKQQEALQARVDLEYEAAGLKAAEKLGLPKPKVVTVPDLKYAFRIPRSDEFVPLKPLEAVKIEFTGGQATLTVRIRVRTRERLNRRAKELHAEQQELRRMPSSCAPYPTWRRDTVRHILQQHPDLAERIVALFDRTVKEKTKE